MVNRIWQYHFGRGLVATSSDFGRLGERCTHPELLDWLASEFVEHGWSIKHLQRLILTSATYRQSALQTASKTALAKDPQNNLLWRQNGRRLDAEQVRDAALVASGELETDMFGPSVPATKPRRTIYTTVLRNTHDPLLEVFDAPDGYLSTPQRNTTTTPTQALLLINGDWMLSQKSLAARLDSQEYPTDDARIDYAYRLIYGRHPSGEEIEKARAFLKKQRERLGADASAGETNLVQTMPQREGSAAVIDSELKQPASPCGRQSQLSRRRFYVGSVCHTANGIRKLDGPHHRRPMGRQQRPCRLVAGGDWRKVEVSAAERFCAAIGRRNRRACVRSGCFRNSSGVD